MMFSFLKSNSSLKYVLAACAVATIAPRAFANELVVPYRVAAGAISKSILVPAVDTPVSVTCTQNAVGFRGVGQATLLRVGTVQPKFLEWVGMDIATSAITSGFSATLGTHIIYCDYVGKTVDIQVMDTNRIQIGNSGSENATGVITFIW